MVLSIDSRRGYKNVQYVSKISVFIVKNKAETVYLIIYRICKNIYVFCFNFLFFNEMICIFASVIKILLEYGKANYTFCAFLLIGISLAIAQAVQVTGVVVSAEDDMPVVGASILVKGTSNGTITDIDGKFTLKVNKGAKLEISYIGMKSQTVAAKNNMKVVLESDTEVLDEVVVTGMQRMDKRLFTGASTKYLPKTLNLTVCRKSAVPWKDVQPVYRFRTYQVLSVQLRKSVYVVPHLSTVALNRCG